MSEENRDLDLSISCIAEAYGLTKSLVLRAILAMRDELEADANALGRQIGLSMESVLETLGVPTKAPSLLQPDLALVQKRKRSSSLIYDVFDLMRERGSDRDQALSAIMVIFGWYLIRERPSEKVYMNKDGVCAEVYAPVDWDSRLILISNSDGSEIADTTLRDFLLTEEGIHESKKELSEERTVR